MATLRGRKLVYGPGEWDCHLARPPVVVFPGSGLLLPEQKYGSKEEGGNTATGRQEAFVFLSKVRRANVLRVPLGQTLS